MSALAAPLELAPTAANPWFDEIDELLECYHRSLDGLDTADEPPVVVFKHNLVNSYRVALAKRGVTVCGGIGHA